MGGAHGGEGALGSRGQRAVVVVRAYKGLLTGPSGGGWMWEPASPGEWDLGQESGLMLRAKVRPAVKPRAAGSLTPCEGLCDSGFKAEGASIYFLILIFTECHRCTGFPG